MKDAMMQNEGIIEIRITEHILHMITEELIETSRENRKVVRFAIVVIIQNRVVSLRNLIFGKQYYLKIGGASNVLSLPILL